MDCLVRVLLQESRGHTWGWAELAPSAAPPQKHRLYLCPAWWAKVDADIKVFIKERGCNFRWKSPCLFLFFTLWIKCLCFYLLIHAYINPFTVWWYTHPPPDEPRWIVFSFSREEYTSWKHFDHAKHCQFVSIFIYKGKLFKQFPKFFLNFPKKQTFFF